jgi:hypothetical protein
VTWRVRVLALAAAGVLGAAAHAAGGHHGVDDAYLIDPGGCELESWSTRGANSGRLLHGGAACRVGPVELGVTLDHARETAESISAQGLQVKWARPWWPGFSAGASLTSGWVAQAQPRWQGATLSTLFSWSVRDGLALHANVGRDFLRARADVPRSGVLVEWAPLSPRWRIEGERFVEDETHFARAGLRWSASERWALEASRAQSLHGPRPSNWTLAATWAFQR